MRGSVTSGAATLLVLTLVLLFLAYFVYNISQQQFSGYLQKYIPNVTVNLPQIINGSTQNATIETSTIGQANGGNANLTLELYALSLINQDRNAFGLQNVTLSNEPSAQQHAESMIENDYFSHWDIYGMKPYMRYTLLGGQGAVDENIAYRYETYCGILGCKGLINPEMALQQMEYQMMYNDSECCNNGHRDNILTPDHNQVSIGIAYNSSSIYFVEDFIDSYINWTSYGPDPTTDEMYMVGTMPSGYSYSLTLITYDPPVQNMTRAQLAQTSTYSYGTEIAGVISGPGYYYPGLESITADEYDVSGNSMRIAFNIKSLIGKYGPGEYTVLVFLDGPSGNSFQASSYTIFVGSSGQIYVPANV